MGRYSRFSVTLSQRSFFLTLVGDSLQAGHATSAVIAGASEHSIMNQTGHRSVQMVRCWDLGATRSRELHAQNLSLNSVLETSEGHDPAQARIAGFENFIPNDGLDPG